MKPMQPDEALAAVVGSSMIPRTEITKKLGIAAERIKSLLEPRDTLAVDDGYLAQ